MAKLVITTSFVSCNTSTASDTCVTGCCSRQSGSSLGDLLTCIGKSACDSNVTQTTTYSTCSQDQFMNTCAQNCCGTYERNDDTSVTSMKICESGSYCDGVYAPLILAKANSAQIGDFKASTEGGISANTGLAVGLGLGLLAIIGIIIGILIWKLRQAKKEVVVETTKAEKFFDEPIDKSQPALEPNRSRVQKVSTFG